MFLQSEQGVINKEEWSRLLPSVCIKTIRSILRSLHCMKSNITTAIAKFKPRGPAHHHNIPTLPGHHRGHTQSDLLQSKSTSQLGLMIWKMACCCCCWHDRRFRSSELAYRISEGKKSLTVCLDHCTIPHSNRAWKWHLNEFIEICPYLWSHLYSM